MLQCRLLPGTANASFCRRRFYLFCQRTWNTIEQLNSKQIGKDCCLYFLKEIKKVQQVRRLSQPSLMAAKKFRHKHKACTQCHLLLRCFFAASHAAILAAFFFSLFSFKNKFY